MDLREVKTDKYTIVSSHIDVGDGHKIWFEQWGRKNAVTPILLFHGGPGSEFKPKHKDAFDPKVHQIIGFDQRGCGNSLPYGEINNNTTQKLVEDAAKLLDYLGINKVHIQGGSWGSAMALLFTLTYPERVASVLIRGIFTASRAEINYVDRGEFKKFYPEVWERFVETVPSHAKNDPAKYHYDHVLGDNKAEAIKSAKVLEELEGPLLGFDWNGYQDRGNTETDKEYDFVPYKIYGHYLANNCFLEDEFILKNAHKIEAPLYIVQGRYDMVCPPITAYKLHRQVKHSKLFMTLSSHAYDPENRSTCKALIETIFN